MIALRVSTKSLFLEKISSLVNGDEECKNTSNRIEETCFNMSFVCGQQKKDEYLKNRIKIINALPKTISIYDTDSIAKFCSENLDNLVMDIFETSQPTPRDTIKKLMFQMINKAGDFSREKIIDIVEKLEKSCYNHTIELSKDMGESIQRRWDCLMFVNLYSNRCGIVLVNLDINSTSVKKYGTYTIDELMKTNITPEILGRMSSQQLNPIAAETEKKELALRTAQKIETKFSKIFKCPNCRQRKCTYKEIQIRSLDEGGTLFATCHNCGMDFKP
jgi:DNA-directed RNA polymerase subunit M/transcription elongation factor TFIIS